MDTVLPTPELHPWVVRTEACLNKTKPSDDGLIRPKTLQRLNACVGKDSVHRSMLIWDRILKAIKGRFRVRMAKEQPWRTLITLDDQEFSINIKEKVKRRDHTPTPEELEAAKGYTQIFQPPKWEYFPSGKLTLAIVNLSGWRIDDQQWSDGKKRRIEDCLDSIADVLAEILDRLVRRRAENEEWERTRPERERQKAEDERQRDEIARLQAEEEKRIDNLKKQVAAWEQASSIRRFVAALRDEATGRCTQGPGSMIEKWIQWAEAQADKIDPVLALAAGTIPEPQGDKPAWFL